MYLTQLTGKQAQELEQLREQLGEIGPISSAGRLMIGRGRSQDSYYAYDEWDYVRGGLSAQLVPAARDPARRRRRRFLRANAARYSEMLPQVRRHFQRIRPASYRMVRGLEDGDEIDFDRTDRNARRAPDGRDSRRPRLQGAQKRSARRRHAVPARHVGLHRRADPSRSRAKPRPTMTITATTG